MIAAVDGVAFGGGLEMALACDLRVASARSRFAQPELSLGILAGAGGNWRLPDVVGVATARRMLYLGEELDAAEALECSLVDYLAEDPIEMATALARRMLERPRRALEITKLALRSGSRPSSEALDLLGQAILFESREKRERMERFVSRRGNG